MSRASRSAGSCATAAATRPFVRAAKRWRQTGIASWRWRSARRVRVALPDGERCPDARVWDEASRLARLAADLGFDCLWSADRHCNDYSFVSDNLQLMTYLTALCPGVDLGTAAVIVPWHDPLRVAEQAAVLDMLSQGRLRLGLGRGLARREFAAFRRSMDESRARFDEAAPMIVNALRTGFIEGDGTFYKQPRIAIRPRPHYAFHGRVVFQMS